MKRICIMILYATVVISVAANSPAHAAGKVPADVLTVQSKSFDTPEKAIDWFVSRVAEGDLSGAMNACMINELDGFDFAAYVKWLNALHP